jgi:hypothetical protein
MISIAAASTSGVVGSHLRRDNTALSASKFAAFRAE